MSQELTMTDLDAVVEGVKQSGESPHLKELDAKLAAAYQAHKDVREEEVRLRNKRCLSCNVAILTRGTTPEVIAMVEDLAREYLQVDFPGDTKSSTDDVT